MSSWQCGLIPTHQYQGHILWWPRIHDTRPVSVLLGWDTLQLTNLIKSEQSDNASVAVACSQKNSNHNDTTVSTDNKQFNLDDVETIDFMSNFDASLFSPVGLDKTYLTCTQKCRNNHCHTQQVAFVSPKTRHNLLIFQQGYFSNYRTKTLCLRHLIKWLIANPAHLQVQVFSDMMVCSKDATNSHNHPLLMCCRPVGPPHTVLFYCTMISAQHSNGRTSRLLKNN